MSQRSEKRRAALEEYQKSELTFYVPWSCSSPDIEISWAKGKSFWYCLTELAGGGVSVVAYEPGLTFKPLQQVPIPGRKVGWIGSEKRKHGKVYAGGPSWT